jgi:hypothetical protein
LDQLEVKEIAVRLKVPPNECSLSSHAGIQRVDQLLDRVVRDVGCIDLDARVIDLDRQP